eukprot:CAMPEP_0202893304 /NCGR_PEP_ID=MMETSP1392-20130828/2914_1 /ASSEMBLY_ACC=CAM_ASM_000868 /TAXON_ID=225041 /ORGANISM="Chlamydomonas chlamydogama, Strain SAG 11-48b" /LENGTH=70 /DNA_ID=CAMNT_0049577591 /DNA_START=87 /DNA_END=299 /DNA_ORIENTATION=+
MHMHHPKLGPHGGGASASGTCKDKELRPLVYKQVGLKHKAHSSVQLDPQFNKLLANRRADWARPPELDML